MSDPSVNAVRSPAGERLAILGNQAFSLINFRGALIEDMVRRRVVVFAFAPDYDAASRRRVEELGAIPVDWPMARTGLNPLRDLRDLYKLSRSMRALRIDTSFAYFIKPVIYGTLAARLAGVKRRFAMIEGAGYVFMAGQRPSLQRTILRNLVTLLYKIGLSQAQRVFMLNRDDQQLFVESGMVTAAKVHRINGIGVALARYPVSPLPTKPLCFLMVSRLLREKGVHEYIEAARIIKAQHPQVRFLLVGSVDLNPGAISLSTVEEWVRAGLVEWPGHVTDVAAWIAQASVFVLPSYGEGLPRSTQEAMAMGRPVITTDVPGCRETVVDGVNGFLVAPRASDALAAAMQRFIAQPELLGSMGKCSRQWAEERYDVTRINAEILEVMRIAR